MNENNRSTASATIDDHEMQNNNQDRIAALKEEMKRMQKQLDLLDEEAARKDLETSTKETLLEIIKNKDERIMIGDKLRAKKDYLEVLEKELKYGKYFAKADNIFPPGNSELIEMSKFKGTADKTKRSHSVTDEEGQLIYEDVLIALRRHLDSDQNSIADLNSAPTSEASDNSIKLGIRSTNNSKSTNSRKARDKIYKHTPGGKPISMKSKCYSEKKYKDCIIPKGDPEKPEERQNGEKGHLIPDAGTCAPWWPFVCLWALGNVEELDGFYEKIERASDTERQKLEDRLGEALVQIATGTENKGGGMRNHLRNFLYVPDSHNQYFDFGYNWVIIPIMTLEEIKDWNDEEYNVAIFVGERFAEIENEKYNHFQDGDTMHTAVAAETKLFESMGPEDIQICTTEDLEKVTAILRHFLQAFADLHTRSRKDDGVPMQDVSPRNWGIVDLAKAVEASIEKSAENKRKKNGIVPPSPTEMSTQEAKQKGTAGEVLSACLKGIEDMISRLSTKGHGGEEKPGIRIPKNPNSNCFGGKHVFKTHIRQLTNPDPIFVAAKGAINFGRQWGIRLMPACPVESDSDSSWNADECCSNATPLPSKDLTGVEIAMVTPSSMAPDNEALIDEDGLSTDAYSDISTGDFDVVDEEGAI